MFFAQSKRLEQFKNNTFKKVFKNFSRFYCNFFTAKSFAHTKVTRCFERGARCQTLSTPLYFSVWVLGDFLLEKDPERAKNSRMPSLLMKYNFRIRYCSFAFHREIYPFFKNNIL